MKEPVPANPPPVAFDLRRQRAAADFADRNRVPCGHRIVVGNLFPAASTRRHGGHGRSCGVCGEMHLHHNIICLVTGVEAIA